MNNGKILKILGIVIIILLVASGIFLFIDDKNRNKIRTITCTKITNDSIKISTEHDESTVTDTSKIIFKLKNNNQVMRIDMVLTSKYSDRESYLWTKENVSTSSGEIKYDDSNMIITSEFNILNLEEENSIFVSSDDYINSYIEDGYTCSD